MGTAEHKARVLRKRDLSLLRAPKKVVTDNPNPSIVGGVIGSNFARHVRLPMDPPDVRADPRGPASLPLIQPKSLQKPLRTQSSIACHRPMMGD